MTNVSMGFSMGDVQVVFGDAHYTPGTGSHRFVVRVSITCTWLDRLVPTSSVAALLIGEVWTDQPQVRWVASLESQVVALRSCAVNEDLVLALSDEQLIALERARGDGDVYLRVKLQATVLQTPDTVYPIARLETGYRIAEGRWLELLDQAGTEVGILLRVPSPLTDSATGQSPRASERDAASLTQAATRLRQARTELRGHQWQHCVATCRQVLENIGLLAELPSVNQLPAKASDRSQDERWAAIYYDVRSLASAAHHDDEKTSGFAWGRADAEPLLAATAGLLIHYTSDRRAVDTAK